MDTIKKLKSTIEAMIRFMDETNQKTIGVSENLNNEMQQIQKFSGNIMEVLNGFKSISTDIEKIYFDSNDMSKIAKDMMLKVKKFKIHSEIKNTRS